jgi:pilus assembly protein CpaE
VFNCDEEYSPALRADLLKVDGLQIVAELDEGALLEQAVAQFPAEALIVHLDPMPEVAMPLAAKIAQSRHDLAVIVISDNADGQYVLTAMRAGIKEYLTKPLEADTLAGTLDRIAASSERSAERGPIISVVGTIGGAGASMLAVNLATEINDLTSKRPVAVVDLDFRYGQLATMLDLQADYTIADLCDTPEQLDRAVVEKVMVKHPSGVHLLARPNTFNQADQITSAHCASILSALQQMYDYVIVDGPNRFDTSGSTIIDMSDVTFVVTQLIVTSVRNAHRMFEELRDAGYNLDRFSVICNRVGIESAHLAVDHIQTTLNRRVDHEVPDDWRNVSSAINMGTPLLESAPKSRVRMAIRELAEKIVNPDAAGDENEEDKAGLLGRIFSSV